MRIANDFSHSGVRSIAADPTAMTGEDSLADERGHQVRDAERHARGNHPEHGADPGLHVQRFARRGAPDAPRARGSPPHRAGVFDTPSTGCDAGTDSRARRGSIRKGTTMFDGGAGSVVAGVLRRSDC